MKLEHISAVCTSQENADEFYHDILGLDRIKDFCIDPKLTEKIFGVACDCTIILYGNEDFTIEIFVPESGEYPHNPFTHHCLGVEDKASFLSKCRAAGLTIHLVPKGEKTLVFVADFDGNIFEIKGGG